MITVVGVAGSALDGAAAEAVRSAGLVAGGRRHLAAAPVPARARTVVMGNVDAALDAVADWDRSGGAAVVLASGDPGYFGVLRSMRARGLTPAVLPAVSSVAAAFARAGLPWDDAVVVSAHGRALRPAVHACRARPKVAVLTGPGAGPAELGAALRGTGRTLVVAEDLGGDERLTRCTAEQAADRAWRDPNVVLCLDESAAAAGRGWVAPGQAALGDAAGAPGWALPEDAFAHRDGMVTKAEMRALALPRLAPRLGTLVWDVGCGSGSVAVECGRLGAAAVAVDRDPQACRLAARNAAAFGVTVTVVAGAAPAALAGLPAPDAVFVGGGGADTPAIVAACAAAGADRIVVALAAVERLAAARAPLAAAGYAVDGVLLQASRLAAMPGEVHRLAPVNPVLLLVGVRP